MGEQRCNLCGVMSEMTDEHVPPKSCGNKGRMHTVQIFQIDKQKSLKMDYQNGIKYHTLCANCNNNVLGAKADIALTDLCNKMKNALESNKHPFIAKINNIDIVKVIKCIFAKFLAMDRKFIDSEYCNSAREFILHNKIPDNLHLYLRFYNYKKIIQARSFAVLSVGDEYVSKGVVSILNFYPVAFVLSSEKEDFIMPDLMSFVEFENPIKDIDISSWSSYNPITKEQLPYDWLEHVQTGKSVVLMAQAATNSMSEKKN